MISVQEAQNIILTHADIQKVLLLNLQGKQLSAVFTSLLH